MHYPRLLFTQWPWNYVVTIEHPVKRTAGLHGTGHCAQGDAAQSVENRSTAHVASLWWGGTAQQGVRGILNRNKGFWLRLKLGCAMRRPRRLSYPFSPHPLPTSSANFRSGTGSPLRATQRSGERRVGEVESREERASEELGSTTKSLNRFAPPSATLRVNRGETRPAIITPLYSHP